MRLVCFGCGKSVSTHVEDDTVVRAVLVCPECVPRMIRQDARTILSPKGEAADAAGADDQRR